MEVRSNELSRRDATALTFANEARRAAWTFGDVPTADGHRVTGTWSFSLAVPADVHDRRMLAEVLMHDRDVLLVADVVRHFDAVLTHAAHAYFKPLAVTEALAPASAEHAGRALAAACQKIAFASGLEVLPPFEVRLSSPTLAVANARADERARAEADAVDRAAHLRRAAELSNVIASTSSIPSTFLETVAVDDRAAALGATLAAASQSGTVAPLFVVAGAKLLRVDLASARQPVTTTMDVADEIGAMRCVQPIDAQWLALGGQRGVQLVAMDEADATGDAYRDVEQSSTLGFNAIAKLAATNEIWATHSKAGVTGWRVGELAAPVARHASYVGAGGLVAMRDDALAFFAGSQILTITPEGVSSVYDAGQEVVAIVPDGGRVHMLCEAGVWIVLDAPSWRVIDRRPTGGRLTAATAMRWLGGIRLLLARREGSIDCLGVDDTLVTRYSSRHVGPRAVTASPTHIAALSGDRQRVLIWAAIDGRDPVAELNVAALTGHRAAGIAFATT